MLQLVRCMFVTCVSILEMCVIDEQILHIQPVLKANKHVYTLSGTSFHQNSILETLYVVKYLKSIFKLYCANCILFDVFKL